MNFEYFDDHIRVSAKSTKGKKDRAELRPIDFYFYSFQPSIENFYDAKRAPDGTGRCVSAIPVIDGVLLSDYFYTHSVRENRRISIGCNYGFRNDFRYHCKEDIWSNIKKVSVNDIFQTHISRIVEDFHGETCFEPAKATECISLWKSCNIVPQEAILTAQFYKHNNVAVNYYDDQWIWDEAIVYPPKDHDKFKINSYCIAFVPPSDHKNTNTYVDLGEKSNDLKQIKKCIEANNKLGVKYINIIDPKNQKLDIHCGVRSDTDYPIFFQLPNDFDCITKYIRDMHNNRYQTFTKEEINKITDNYNRKVAEKERQNNIEKLKKEKIQAIKKDFPKQQSQKKLKDIVGMYKIKHELKCKQMYGKYQPKINNNNQISVNKNKDNNIQH